MKMKRILYFTIVCIIFLCNTHAYAQVANDSLKPKQNDTSKIIRKKNTSSLNDTLRKNHKPDTSKIMKKQKVSVPTDTARKTIHKDSLTISKPEQLQGIGATNSSEKDTSVLIMQSPLKNYRSITNELLLKNRFINVKDAPVYVIQEERNPKGKEFLFYALCIVVLILGIFKTFYSQYFNNLFRVFFNTSLRQTQLTDQLLQAKLPSFILNIFFIITAGVYIWLLFTHFHPPRLISARLLLPFCILSVALLYFIKYCLLKFMGWVSDIRQLTDNYIFVIFLINKITGILLVPFIILLAFSMPQWTNAITTISLLVLGLFFLSRYVKSYGVIHKKIPINPFHFLIYIVGAEIIPLVLIYKITIDYLI